MSPHATSSAVLQTAPNTQNTCVRRIFTFPLHPHGEALLIAAVLAAVALALVYEAVLVVPAGVDQVLPDRPLEEALAALATVHPVVLPWGGRTGREQARRSSTQPQM